MTVEHPEVDRLLGDLTVDEKASPACGDDGWPSRRSSPVAGSPSRT